MKIPMCCGALAFLVICGISRSAEIRTNSPQPMAMEQLKPLAEGGNSGAMRAYGLRHWMEILGAPQDPVEALKWVRKSAEKGDALGQFIMALACIRGYQSEINENEAIRWARLASDQGDHNAKNILAQLYQMGIGLPRTPDEEPKKLLEMLERKSNADAMAIRAEEFLLSEEGARDIPKAWGLVVKAMEAGGHLKKMSSTLVVLRNLAEPPQDPIGRYIWAYTRTEARDHLALHIMGEAFSTKEMGPVDYLKAFSWFQKAAEAGHFPAWERLGNHYEKGLGVTQDGKRAVECYRMASTNLPSAKVALERMTGLSGGQR